MTRSSVAKAVILCIKPLGENNSSVTVFSENEGIIYAALYGGPKSRLKSLVSTWNSGNIWLYADSHGKKITDFDVKNYHTSFSQSLFKVFAANLAAEIVIKTKCAGSSKECFNLFCGFLDGLEIADENQGKVGLVRFLWRYLELLGIQPDASLCGRCGNSFLKNKNLDEKFDENKNSSYHNNAVFVLSENSFICEKCAENENLLSDNVNIQLKMNNVRYLAGVSLLKPCESRKLFINEEGYFQIKKLVFYLAQNAVGEKLNTMITGASFL